MAKKRYIKSISKGESNFDANAKAPGSTAEGMFQIIKGTRDSLGLKDPFDPVASSNAAMEYLQRLKKNV